MALITCPECGKNISSTTDICVHCGCQIKTCPECGNAVLSEHNVCQNCGYEFKTAKINNLEKNISHEKKALNDIRKDILLKNKNLFKTIETLYSILLMGFLACIAIVSIIVFIIIVSNPSNLIMATSTLEMFGLFIALFVFNPIILILELIATLGDTVSKLVLAIKIKKEGFDVKKTKKEFVTGSFATVVKGERKFKKVDNRLQFIAHEECWKIFLLNTKNPLIIGEIAEVILSLFIALLCPPMAAILISVSGGIFDSLNFISSSGDFYVVRILLYIVPIILSIFICYALSTIPKKILNIFRQKVLVSWEREIEDEDKDE